MKLWLILALSFTASWADCRTLTQLRSDARLLARDAGSNTRQRFIDSDVTNFMNQAMREAVSRTDCIERSFTFQLQQGVTYYAMPSDYQTARRVTRGNLALTELTPAGLDGRSRGWETASGKPVYYFVNFSSRGLMGFTPFPQQSTDTDTIKVDYFATVTDMVNDNDVPFNAINEFSDYHQILPYYAASRMVAIDGRIPLAQLYVQIYEVVIKQMSESCKARPNYLPGAVGQP